MALVCVVLGAGLAVAAWHSRGGVRAWFLLWAALNLGTAGHMMATAFPDAWHLQPAGDLDLTPRR